MNTITPELLQTIDSHNIYDVLSHFPDQVEEGLRIGEQTDVTRIHSNVIHNIVITGLGGSAIGGDILRSFLSDEARVPIFVNRHYILPKFVDRSSLVITSSYSGDTEETLSAYNAARAAGAQILAITSGGALGAMAQRDGASIISIPGGLAPRCALGYSFFPMLQAVIQLGIAQPGSEEMEETLSTIRTSTGALKNYSSDSNTALFIAHQLIGRIPIIYSAQDRFDAVNIRWRCQLEENAKVIAYGNFFPELNHNEIVGWEQLPDVLKRFAVIFLRNRDEHPRIERRMDFTLKIARQYAADVIECRALENTLLARTFGLICLGDWVSFYTAILSDIDPYPIEKINALKAELEKDAAS